MGLASFQLERMSSFSEQQALVATGAIAPAGVSESEQLCAEISDLCADGTPQAGGDLCAEIDAVLYGAGEAEPVHGLVNQAAFTFGDGWEDPPIVAPLSMRWPEDGTYATWARMLEAACRSEYGRTKFFEAAAAGPQAFANELGGAPAAFLVKKASSTIMRCVERGRTKVVLPSRPAPSRERGEPSRPGRPKRVAPVAVRPGSRWVPEHHYAFKKDEEVARRDPGPRPGAKAPVSQVAAWVRAKATTVDPEEGRAAYNEAAYVLSHGRFDGTKRAYAHAVQQASVYGGSHETPSSNAPAYVTHSLNVCGEVVSTVDELREHEPCFRQHKPLYRAALSHLQGRLPEPDWARLTRALVTSRCAFTHTKPRGGVLRCRRVVPEPYVPGQHIMRDRMFGPRQPAHEVFPEAGAFRYQGGVLSACERLDWYCRCQGQCEHGDPSLPGTGEAPKTGPTVRYQGAVSSVPVGSSGAAITVAHTFPQVDAIVAVMAASGVGDSTARKLAKVAALLVGLATSTSALNAVSIVTGFVAGDDWLYARASAFVARLSGRVHFQGPGDWPADMLTGLARAFWASAVLAALREACGSVSDMVALGVTEFASQIKVLAAKDAAREVLDVVIGALKEFWGRLTSAWEQKSWEPLFGVSRDPKRWAKWSEGVLINHQLLVTPAPRPGERVAEVAELSRAGVLPPWVVSSMTNGQYLTLVEHLHSVGVNLLAGVPNGTLAASIRTIVNKLAGKVNLVTASIRGSRTRPVPFFVYLHGKAGTGKSNLAGHIFRAVGAKRGLPIDDQSRWLWQKGVNFQDGLDISKWCIALDDVDHIKGTFSASDELFPQTIVRLVNNEPFPVEAAGVEEKGTLFAAPLLVTQASNFNSAQVSKYGAFPDAFWRRVGIHAEVRVKPAFCKVVAGQVVDELDPAKVGNSLDIYDIFVGTYVGQQDDETAPYFTPAEEPVSISEFLVEIHRRMDEHEATQDRILRSVEAGERCLTCYLPAAQCPCPKVRRQMKRSDYAVLEREGSGGESDDESLPEPTWATRVYDRFWRACTWCDDRARGGVVCGAETCAVGAGFCAVAALKGVASLPKGCVAPVVRLCGPGCTASAWALSLAVQMVEDAVVEFPYATAATLAVGAAALYALYAGGTWLLQGRGAGVDTSSWVPVPSVFGPTAPSVPPKATWTLDQLKAAVDKSLFPFRTTKTQAFALAITPNLLAIPTHLVAPGDEFELEMAPGRWQKFTAHPSWVEKSLTNREVAYFAVRTAGSAGVLPYLPPVHNLGVLQFDEGVLLGPGDRGAGSGFQLSRGLSGELVLKGKLETQDGDCGRPYAVRAGNSWWLGGVHYGLMTFLAAPSQAVAAPLTQREARAAALHLDGGGVVPGGPVVVPQGLARTAGGEPWVLDSQPRAYSEVLTAISTGRGRKAHYLGTLRNGPAGATPKSRLRPTLFADLFRDLELKYCGSSPYWGPPIFSGRMAASPSGPEWWVSPFQSAFEAGRDAKPDRATFVVAVMDYLHGSERLYWEELRHLSLAEALVGVPEIWHNPVNPSTSSGLPKNQPKWMQIQRAFRDVSVEPELYALLEELWGALSGGSPISVPGAWTLKDEPVKPGKEARVFTVLPVAFNLTLARVLAPVFAAMRAHPEHFECWVGVDMTSPDVERLVRFLRNVCPDLDRVGDTDAKKQDKAFDTFSWVAVRLVYSAIGYFAGLDRALIENAVRSEEFVRFLYKGDLFEHPQDPSGVKGVIENNSIDCSIKARYDYYRDRPDFVASVDWRGWLQGFAVDPTVPDLGFTFRQDCANAQFGDDNVHALRPGVAPVVHPERMLRECGVEVTSGDKSGSVALGPLGSVSFLKRTLVFDQELGYHLAPLALKSVVKSCVVRMPTTLSDADHAALVLTHVVREAALHGDLVFEEFRSRAIEAARRLGLEGHKLLRIHSYENYRERLRRGVFSVYKDLGETGSSDYLAAESAGLIGAQELL